MNLMKNKIVYITGVWDLFHIGHLNILENARALGDELIVGIRSDKSTEEGKGRRPIIPEKERARLIESLKCVDKAVIFNITDQSKILETLGVDVFVIGSDYSVKDPNHLKTLDYVKKADIQLVTFPYTQSISTTKIRELVVKNHDRL